MVLTVRLRVWVDKQPNRLLPVTVYKVVAAGEAVKLLAVIFPGTHVYPTAPRALSVEVEPKQIAAGDAVTVIAGNGFTVKITFAWLVHVPRVPTTV